MTAPGYRARWAAVEKAFAVLRSGGGADALIYALRLLLGCSKSEAGAVAMAVSPEARDAGGSWDAMKAAIQPYVDAAVEVAGDDGEWEHATTASPIGEVAKHPALAGRWEFVGPVGCMGLGGTVWQWRRRVDVPRG